MESKVLGMQKHDRLIRQRRKLGVDVRYDVGYATLNLILLGRLESNLNENSLATAVSQL
jgi:hypothetical protein